MLERYGKEIDVSRCLHEALGRPVQHAFGTLHYYGLSSWMFLFGSLRSDKSLLWSLNAPNWAESVWKTVSKSSHRLSSRTSFRPYNVLIHNKGCACPQLAFTRLYDELQTENSMHCTGTGEHRGSSNRRHLFRCRCWCDPLQRSEQCRYRRWYRRCGCRQPLHGLQLQRKLRCRTGLSVCGSW
ncbi:hypothetical protein D3C85_1305770 [compost metagenome]